MLSGEALSGAARVPFLFDVEVHARFLVALPLLETRRLEPRVVRPGRPARGGICQFRGLHEPLMGTMHFHCNCPNLW